MKFWRERKRERERKMAKYLASKLVGTRGFYKQTSLVKEMYLRFYNYVPWYVNFTNN
jgi:hypothetical protein